MRIKLFQAYTKVDEVPDYAEESQRFEFMYSPACRFDETEDTVIGNLSEEEIEEYELEDFDDDLEVW